MIEPPSIDLAILRGIGRSLLTAIGEDPDRPGLKDTPDRFARMWSEFINYDPGKTDTVFESSSTGIAMVSGVRVYSLCEHHLMPFWVDLAMGYIPSGQVLGLSKFARIAHLYGHRLQIQERMTDQIGHHLANLTNSKDVIVVAKGEHTCMTMRGIKAHGNMLTVYASGRFEDVNQRREFFTLAGY